LPRTGISEPLVDSLRVMQLSPGRLSAALARFSDPLRITSGSQQIVKNFLEVRISGR